MYAFERPVDRLGGESAPFKVDGKAAGVFLSVSDYEDLLDTSDPAVADRIKRSHNDVVEGKTRPARVRLKELRSEN